MRCKTCGGTNTHSPEQIGKNLKGVCEDCQEFCDMEPPK